MLAVVTGSAINSDGASNGLTAPNGLFPGARHLRGAGKRQSPLRTWTRWRRTGPEPGLGDPIEAQALICDLRAGSAAKASRSGSAR